MLNYETLLSSYDDKLTLMQWLKKVEDALKDASAVAFNVNKRGDATLTFSVVFEDGTELETGPIVLEQGESVASAAIVGGHLKLTLTNGDVLDAGDLGGVSSFSIDASQHLIVHYQNGTTQDLGAIFSGSITINGGLSVSGGLNVGTGDGNTSLNGDLSVAGLTELHDDLIVDGSISGGEIVERMTGYRFIPATKENVTCTHTYAGVVKNGNKLTYVIFLTLKRTGTVANGFFNAGDFVLPAEIMAKLYPYSLTGLNNVLIDKAQDAFSAVNSAPKQLWLMTTKQSGYVSNILYGMGNLDVDVDYVVRIEQTFLLSENLAA